MATVDTSNFKTKNAEMVYSGVCAATFRISCSVCASAGDIWRIGKLPHGAIPLDAIFYPGAALLGTSVMKFGTSQSQEMFFASATYSVAGKLIRCTLPLGSAQQISLSDDKMPRYEPVVWVPGGSGTVPSLGFMGELVVIYRMPGQGKSLD